MVFMSLKLPPFAVQPASFKKEAKFVEGYPDQLPLLSSFNWTIQPGSIDAKKHQAVTFESSMTSLRATGHINRATGYDYSNPKKLLNPTNTMSSKEIVDKEGEPLEIGDEVSTKIRGGKRTGVVSDIVTTQEEADKKAVKNPPKVLFEDQHGTYPT